MRSMPLSPISHTPSVFSADKISNKHMIAQKQEFQYNNCRKDWQLCFRADREDPLQCDVNSDYDGCPDGYKSTSRLLITLGGAVN